jgi:hypothetical protein
VDVSKQHRARLRRCGADVRVGERVADRASLFIEIELYRAPPIGQDRPGVAGGHGQGGTRHGGDSRHGQGSRYRSDFIEPAQARLEVSRAAESHRRALAEPDVRLSPHPAPIVRPRPCKSPQWANSDGCRRATRAIQCAVCRRWRRKDLNFRCAHRARIRSMCRRVG